ncbi:MAG: hypothetical protein KDC12_03180 [Flavobacteriales bacterium]|nr:hypothetical protein [Flavobacteriales bacterium]
MSSDFPLYRKYVHGASYFRIDSEDQCVERQIVGSRHIEHVIHARQYPEKVLIRNLINLVPPAVESSPEEFEAVK